MRVISKPSIPWPVLASAGQQFHLASYSNKVSNWWQFSSVLQGVPVLIQVGKGQPTLVMRTITYLTTELNSVIQPVTDQNSNNNDIVEIRKKGYIMQHEIRDYENTVTTAN